MPNVRQKFRIRQSVFGTPLEVIINWMKIGFSKNEYSEGVKMHGLTKNFGKFLFFDQKL